MNEIIHKVKGYLGYGVPVNIAGDLFYKNPETLDELAKEYKNLITKIKEHNKRKVK